MGSAGCDVPIGARRLARRCRRHLVPSTHGCRLAGAAISKGVEDWEVKKEQRALAEAMSGKKQKKVCFYKVPLQRGGPPRPPHACLATGAVNSSRSVPHVAAARGRAAVGWLARVNVMFGVL